MEIIKTRWFMEKKDFSTYEIQEVKEDGDTFFDVSLENGDYLDTYDTFRQARQAVENAWENERLNREWEEEEKNHYIPDSVGSLGLVGMFGA